MRTYITKRLLLIPVTLLGVTFLVFCLTRLVPGGPVEQILRQQTMSSTDGKNAQQFIGNGLSEEELEKLEEQFGIHDSILKSYLQWLGFLPRETFIAKADFSPHQENQGKYPNSPTSLHVILPEYGEVFLIERDSSTGVKIKQSHSVNDSQVTLSDRGIFSRIESASERQERTLRRGSGQASSSPYPDRVVLYKKEFNGLLQGSFGTSFKYNEPVWEMMKERLPVTLYFGFLTALLTYFICIPLGIIKAIYHRSWVDHFSSLFIFMGYTVPGFALGALLLVYLSGRLEWFPLSGFVSLNFKDMSWTEQCIDLIWHTILPLICYTVGNLAMFTIMMKNSLMDHLSADYMRTAVAKGTPFRRTVLTHAFRNAFIPIATSLGSILGFMVAGSILIEHTFDIQGFGLLSYQAIQDKDYALILGTLTLSTFFMMAGNLLSDILISWLDPRIRFQ